MKLRELCSEFKYECLSGSMDVDVRDVIYDSRKITEGTVFVCMVGAVTDGHKYIPDAVKKGASAIVVERADEAQQIPDQITVIQVESARRALAYMSAALFGHPDRKLVTIGITGTKGKTTTTYMIKSVLEMAGKKVGLIGTIGAMIGDEHIPSKNTTPESYELHRMFAAMVEAGCEYVVMEGSSHALALNRVAGCEYDTAALTNITQDHLDFHKTLENYRDAKGLLFEHLHEGKKENKTAVFNMDDASSPILCDRTKTRILTYGEGRNNDIYPLFFKVEAKQMRLQLHTPVGEMDLLLKITGEFNVYNVMAAVAIALAEQIDKKTIVDVLNGFDGVPGRFQLVEAGQPYTVIVDYAHTPDGLENVLKTARSITEGKLWVVFGCGGDRDNKKRPIMGRIALELADRVVVTSDNPRTEDPAVIIDEIAEALKDVPEGKSVELIAERRDAIYHALSEAAANDVIMIAGKGHENYQILADKTIHFDDREVVQEYWKKR